MDERQIVSLTLRDSETCTAAAGVWDSQTPASAAGSPSDHRLVLAVVTHRSAADGENADSEREEGCLFVMKYRSPLRSELYPYKLFPIVSDLTMSLKQTNDGTSSFNVPQFELTLKSTKKVVTLTGNETEALSSVLEESRRLKSLVAPDSSLISLTGPATTDSDSTETSGTEKPPDSEQMEKAHDQDHEERHWEWLHFYLSHKFNRILPSQRPKPHDIRRVLNGDKLSASYAGSLFDEETDIALIRDQWIRRQLSSRKSEYIQMDSIKLRIGTFNVNDKQPTESLASWVRGSSASLGPSLFNVSEDAIETISYVKEPSTHHDSVSVKSEATLVPESSSLNENTVPDSIDSTPPESHPVPSTPPSPVDIGNGGELPDLFVFGFQELDLSPEAFLYGGTTLKAETWMATVFDALGKDADDYTQLVHKQLVGILLVVIIRKSMQSVVKEISTSSAAVGIMGIMGNKGATAVRLRLNSSTVTFVCSHLAAYDEYFEKRNSDHAEICRKLQFPISWKGARSMQPLTANVWESDVLFWFGDLNYRIDLPDHEVRKLLEGKPQHDEFGTLFAHDQLKTASRRKRAFSDFVEHDISFPPTYRFADLSADELGYDTKRQPAWTDRILYHATNSGHVSQTSYRDHPRITLSDHRPVSANFDMKIETHDPHELHKVATALHSQLGDFEDSDEVPTVALPDGIEVDFGEVYYLHPLTKTFRVKNEANVACAFRFLAQEQGFPVSKEWLTVEPLNGILLAQETLEITLTIHIDKRTASFLNHGNTKIQDRLIMHIFKGHDHFVSVSGSYQPTCFANSLAWLVRSPGPIRGGTDTQLLPEANTLSSPRELMFLIEYLITNAQDIDDLFLTRGDESLVDLIRLHLDTQPLESQTKILFPEGTDNRAIGLAFAETMLRFLDSLTEPVIPWVLHPRCALAKDREDVFEVLDHIPGFARNVYVTITAFLHFIGQKNSPEKPAHLAKVFANILLPDDPQAPQGIPSLTPLEKRHFLLLCIS